MSVVITTDYNNTGVYVNRLCSKLSWNQEGKRNKQTKTTH